MKVLVTYFSQSGNTEKLARGIYDGLERQTAKDILPINEVKDVNEYDLIFCGFPVHSSSVPGPVESFIKTIPEGKNLAFFGTHGSFKGGPLALTAFYYAITLAPKAKIIGSLSCRGKVKQAIIDSLMEKVEHRGWALEAQSAAGHPDDSDIEDAKEFAALMFAKVRPR